METGIIITIADVLRVLTIASGTLFVAFTSKIIWVRRQRGKVKEAMMPLKGLLAAFILAVSAMAHMFNNLGETPQAFLALNFTAFTLGVLAFQDYTNRRDTSGS